MTLRFTFRQLEYFVAVGEAGSIARAADMLNISAPSVSTAIQQLEQELGVELFVRRHAQGVSLTTSGRQIFQETRRLLTEAEGLTALASDMAERVRGPLSIGCLTTFAQFLLPDVRRAFETAYPDVRIRQYERHQNQLIEMLQRGEIDVALTYDIELPRDVSFDVLLELPPYALVGADHELADKPSVSLRDLAELPMVLLDLPLSREYFLSMFQQLGLSPLITERTADLPLARTMVANGFGYSLANIRPRTDLAPDGKAVRYLPLSENPRPLQLGVVMIASGRRARNAEAFAEHCRRTITPDNTPGLAPRASAAAYGSRSDRHFEPK